MPTQKAARADGPDAKRTKRSIYLPSDVLQQVEGEARRRDCSVSYVFRLAWSAAWPTLRQDPDVVPGDA